MSDQHPAHRLGIVTDSSCDLPGEIVTRLGIEVVPLSIRFGDVELVDREELSTDEFWARCATAPELPGTAAPAPGRFEQAYRRLAAAGAGEIIVLTLSGALSATFQSAELAARTVATDGISARVIDSRTLSMGLGTIVIACAEAAAEAADLDVVAELAVGLVTRTRLFGALDTMENLHKGGRIGGAKALLATALSIKPIIEVRDGVVQQLGKQRTRAKALRFLVDDVAAKRDRVDHLAVMHADCADVDDFVGQLRPHYDGEIVVGQIGPVIGTHAGRGTIGVAYLERTAG